MGAESIGKLERKHKQQVQAVNHTVFLGGDRVKKVKEITYTNYIRIGDQRIRIDDLPEDKKEAIINRLIYNSLSAIPNTEVIQTA